MPPVARLGWLGALTIGIALFVVDERVMVDTANPNFVPSVILLGAAVVPVAFVLFVAERRLPYDVPAGVVFTAALLGGVIGTVTAGLLEYDTLRRLGVLPMLAVAVIEEAAKLVVPLAIVVFTRYRRPADGVLVGVASGAGFAALETMGYAFVALVRSHGSLITLDNVLLLRGLLAPAGHMAWTGATAAALWIAFRTGRWLRFGLVFVLAVVLHAAWDSIGTLTGYALIATVSLLFLGALTHRTATATAQ
ncbi:PrsW family intramembrane metalloprotease [Streptantibioticus rubrisoli]|uniref:PrsW family intramembrane metalloprotease n=1 Tax=Streptantibioticus rubrisoli TaxID=1387313 RepID=A0ABT1PBL8_9ACTN|nr:PrsW family glutamic-type intramembrane protease [Streptantibioticus rubrisoli]MCQ4042767.1 PrsW family intramembrane metalloprotease [Streptantibioticus rubrisoli]